MKVLIVGLGSIGKRHATCLLQFNNIELAILRTAKGTLKEKSEYLEFYSLEQALNFEPDGVIIANPTSLHVSTALPFLEKGIKLLIEKPIAFSSTEASVLLKYAHLIRVAYCFRFHRLNSLISKICLEEKVLKLGFKRSYYLPKWHPYADYRTEYTASKSLGGGVIRTLSHEIDLMVNWLGFPNSIIGTTDKISDLEIDTDDYAFFTCKYNNKCRVNFELDFLSPINTNLGELYTSKGKYQWDSKGFQFTAYSDNESTIIESFSAENINEMYVKQMADFIDYIETGNSKNTDLTQSIDVLKIIEQVDGK